MNGVNESIMFAQGSEVKRVTTHLFRTFPWRKQKHFPFEVEQQVMDKNGLPAV